MLSKGDPFLERLSSTSFRVSLGRVRTTGRLALPVHCVNASQVLFADTHGNSVTLQDHLTTVYFQLVVFFSDEFVNLIVIKINSLDCGGILGMKYLKVISVWLVLLRLVK